MPRPSDVKRAAIHLRRNRSRDAPAHVRVLQWGHRFAAVDTALQRRIEIRRLRASTHVPHVDDTISAFGRCPGHPSRMTKRPYAGIGPTKPCVAGVYPSCRKIGRYFRPPAGIPYGSARSGEIGGRFGDCRAPNGSRDSPVSIFHILASVLAAHSSSIYLPEEQVLPPVEFGRSHVCRTVGFPGRLRQNPAGKPDGR
jgi:hypothetical protein